MSKDDDNVVNLFDKAMPHRKEGKWTGRIQHKCQACGKWIDAGRWVRHLEKHRREET